MMAGDDRDVTAGAIGGLVGAAVVSGLLLLAARGGPDELVQMDRRAASRLGLRHRAVEASPTVAEEALAQGLHLALSAALGAIYGALRHRIGLRPVPAGLVLGLGFYPIAFGMAGPALGITKRAWDEPPLMIGQRTLVHAVFGAVTALVAERIAPMRHPAGAFARPRR